LAQEGLGQDVDQEGHRTAAGENHPRDFDHRGIGGDFELRPVVSAGWTHGDLTLPHFHRLRGSGRQRFQALQDFQPGIEGARRPGDDRADPLPTDDAPFFFKGTHRFAQCGARDAHLPRQVRFGGQKGPGRGRRQNLSQALGRLLVKRAGAR